MIGDRVWLDLDGDGIQDANEDGIANATVKLLSADGTELATRQTDESGSYLFDELASGQYTVMIDPDTLPPSLQQTFDADGTESAHQSSIVLDQGVFNLEQDFGYQPLGRIGDRVWQDTNDDGVQDPSESGIEGVMVKLLDENGNELATRTTDADGIYRFSDLPPGDYQVAVDESTLPGTMVPTYDRDGGTTGPDGLTNEILDPGENVDTIDFGYRLAIA